MPFSNFTPLTEIAENSAATPGLWNAQYSTLSRNFSQLITDASNASNQSTGNIPYAQLPTGSGTWQTGSGTTVTVARGLVVSSHLSVGGDFTVGAFQASTLTVTSAVSIGGSVRFSTPSAGSILVGSGSAWAAGRVFPGTNITVTESASGITIDGAAANAFATVANGSGTSQFGAASNDTIRFGSGSELSITFDGSNKSLTYSMQSATAAGQLWIGAAAGSWSRATITPGVGVVVTNAANAITIRLDDVSARAHSNSTTSIDSGTWTTLVFGLEDYDTDAIYDTSNGRFTVPTGYGGKWDVGGQAAFVPGGASHRYMRILKNGADILASTSATATATEFWKLPVVDRVALVAGDYIQIQTQQDSGSAMTLYHDVASFNTANSYGFARFAGSA